MKELEIEKADVSKPELQLALQLIGQITAEDYDPAEFKDEEKQRVLAAIDRKIAGEQVVESAAPEPTGGQVIDLMDALRASLAGPAAKKPAAKAPAEAPAAEAKERKGAKRAAAAPAAEAPPARTRKRAAG
jgi:DNA end-binding protein Ku